MNWRQYLKLLFIACKRFYLLFRCKKMVKSHIRHLQALTTVPVREPVTEPGTQVPVPVPDFTGGSGSGTGAKFRSGRVLTQMSDTRSKV